MPISTNSYRPLAGWLAVIASCALIVGAVVLFGMSRSAAAGDDVSSAQLAEELELMEARRVLELGTLNVVIARMLDDAGIDGEHSERLEQAADDVRSATATIVELGNGDGVVAAEAQAIVEAVDLESLEDPIEGSLDELFYVVEEVVRYVGSAEIVVTPRAVVQQLSFVNSLPYHVLVEGIAADISVNDRPYDLDHEEFYEFIIGVVRTDGGWFGPDLEKPLAGSEWIKIAEATEMLPSETARLNEIVAASPLIGYDLWMADLGVSDAAPPIDAVVALGLADELYEDTRIVLDEAFAVEAAARAEARAAQESDSQTLRLYAIIAAVIALAALIAGISSVSRAGRASRERAAMALRDSLTGIGNRHELEERTRKLTVDERFTHHLVAMIDLDRFKMVNDVHGHAAGDAILIEIATQLERIANGWSRRDSSVDTTVVRLGGDEFLLTLHGRDSFDTAALRLELEEVRNRWIDYVGERIALGFSIGIVHVEGQHELADLMGAADLAVYDDKATRAHARKAAAGALPPPDLPSSARPGTVQY